jgi:SAM-dependent methyltransferase
MTFISKKLGQFPYFDQQLGQPDWRGKRVLDFGGNIGNLLRHESSTIDHDKYWCIDVSRDAIEFGKQAYSEAHWIFYDRYNFAFNPTGVEGLELPGIEVQFDYILAYSVFTHLLESEMLELITKLEKWLGPNGILAFTFIDPHFNPARSNGGFHPGYYDGTCLQQRLDYMKGRGANVDVQSLLARAENARWCVLVNEDDLYIENENIKFYEEKEKSWFCTFYSVDYMQARFPDATVLQPPPNAYPHGDEVVLQHCCVIRKANDQ